MIQDRTRGQIVIQNHIRLGQTPGGFQCQQFRIAGTGRNQ